MTFQLILFDLDNTLVNTDDLSEFRGINNIDRSDAPYITDLQIKLNTSTWVYYISEKSLNTLKLKFPDAKFGIFTKSPKEYAKIATKYFYPNFNWDVIVAFEDVSNTKPKPDGIYLAAETFGLTDPTKVVMIGDSPDDVLAAYNAGIWSFAHTPSWKEKLDKENFKTIGLMPDAITYNESFLLHALQNPHSYLPILERLNYYYTANIPEPNNYRRITNINFFSATQKAHTVWVLGRRFRDDKALACRRSWHPVSAQVENLKNASTFPNEWINAICAFIHTRISESNKICITVIPAKPNRIPRLEKLLNTLAASFVHPNQNTHTIKFTNDILKFSNQAISLHENFLSAKMRKVAIESTLELKSNYIDKDYEYIIIDDVVTSGATLLHAKQLLIDCGVEKVHLLSLTKAISTQ